PLGAGKGSAHSRAGNPVAELRPGLSLGSQGAWAAARRQLRRRYNFRSGPDQSAVAGADLRSAGGRAEAQTEVGRTAGNGRQRRSRAAEERAYGSAARQVTARADGASVSELAARTRRILRAISNRAHARAFRALLWPLWADFVVGVDRVIEVFACEAREPGLRRHPARDWFGKSEGAQSQAAGL